MLDSTWSKQIFSSKEFVIETKREQLVSVKLLFKRSCIPGWKQPYYFPYLERSKVTWGKTEAKRKVEVDNEGEVGREEGRENQPVGEKQEAEARNPKQ